MSVTDSEREPRTHVVMCWGKIKPEYLEDAVRLSIDYAERSVAEEPGCRRFDVVQDEHDPTRIAYYEIFDDVAAFEAHRETAHFRESHADEKKTWPVAGGISMCKPVFPVGDVQWDAKPASAAVKEASYGGLYIYHGPLRVRPSYLEDFAETLRLEAMASVAEEPGCLRFDVHQNKDNANEFYLYQVFVNRDAFEHHSRTPHAEKRIETVQDWYDPDFSLEDNPAIVTGANVWPPDHWNWRYRVE